MYRVHKIAFWLSRFGLQNPKLENCIDLQLVYEITENMTVMNANIPQIASNCFQNSAKNLELTTHSYIARAESADAKNWTKTPLPSKMQLLVALAAQLYAQCYAENRAKSSDKVKCAIMTGARWEFAVINKGHKAIWFDPKHDNQPRSLECFLECELEPLLDLLSTSYKDAILKLDNYHELVDICINTGKHPLLILRAVLNSDSALVSKAVIDEILMNIGGEMRIGNEIGSQLHRISVMRSKMNEIYAITMRVGRALRNAACVLTDLLLSERHADKSVLMLGYSGCGKTTLIRDVARCVSEMMENVCIIDTSNEIGGDGLVPHSCVGWARRIMVRSLEAQASVMIECVQNHTVEILIVDEIGRIADHPPTDWGTAVSSSSIYDNTNGGGLVTVTAYDHNGLCEWIKEWWEDIHDREDRFQPAILVMRGRWSFRTTATEVAQSVIRSLITSSFSESRGDGNGSS
ncbi:hypothetical protein PsorP6_017888 [Peronosclerospora sorghi]|uniref:Uncharacterized protein n=1 Tax=Peronosclerospora sorghi TaxID=230839 RepID=A0ACC0WFB5_9STRA|nr:hypothetical protein PsorP6_017888 [Peronosclerospora sorghi]